MHTFRPCSASQPSSRVLGAISRLAFVVQLGFVVAAVPAWAQPQADDQIDCIVKLNKVGAMILKTQAKVTGSCQKAGAKGSLTAEAVSSCLRADTKGAVQKGRDKAAAIEADACTTTPDFGFAGATGVADGAVKGHLGLMEGAFGADFGDVTIHQDSDATGAKCQAAVKKAVDKTVGVELKEFAKCKSAGLKDGSITDAASLAACLATVAADAGGKLAKAHAKLATTMDKKCPGVDADAAFPGVCVGAPDAADCLAQLSDCRSCLMVAAMDGLDPAVADCDTFDDGMANSSCILCNGSAELCDRSYEDVVFATSHNAMSNGEEGWLAPNNSFTVVNQLGAGARALMLDTWYHAADAVLCHGGELAPGIGCDLTGMKPLDVGLTELDAFLDANPNEVLSIIFESYISEADTEADFIASGLIDHVHVQSLAAPWPTLREMIVAGKRLVVFTDDSGVALPWHHYVWDHAWETHFSNEEPEDFSCAPNRGSTSNDLFILNHFLTSPVASPALASMVNFNPFFIDRAEQCQTESGDLANFVTVDFEDIGDLYEVVRELNGLP